MEIQKHLQSEMDSLTQQQTDSTSQTSSELQRIETAERLYADIELTDIERRTAILEAKERKREMLEAQRKQQMRLRMEESLRKPWTAQELMQEVHNRAVYEFKLDGKRDRCFELNEQNEKIYHALALYFANDPEFEALDPHWKLDKGLLIAGNIGVGKSVMMRLFARNKRQCYELISCRKIADQFATTGHEALEFYTQPKRAFFEDPQTYFQRQIGYCFDDLGTENEKKNYGNQVNVMADIILNRYDRKFEYPWCQTHITTNLSADQIEQFYGARVRDRMREMFNKIVFVGQSLRV